MKTVIISVLRFIKKKFIYFLKLLKKVEYILRTPFHHNVIILDEISARKELESFSPKPSGKATAHNIICKPYKYDLQIVIAAYNVEKYIKKCLDSVLTQETKYSIKVVVVDDGSTDETGKIIDSYQDDARLFVIHQSNQGLSAARNAGIRNIEAPYLMFIDSDDWIGGKSVDALLATAIENEADIVEGGHCTVYGESIQKINDVHNVTKLQSVSDLWGVAHTKVYKSDLFSDICFMEGYWFEDTINKLLIYPRIKDFYKIPEYIYYYRMNQNSIMHVAKTKAKVLDTFWITEELVKEYHDRGFQFNEMYLRLLLQQILMNAKRLKNHPEKIQRSVFVLSSLIIKKYFCNMINNDSKNNLLKSLIDADYGAYNLYILTH